MGRHPRNDYLCASCGCGMRFHKVYADMTTGESVCSVGCQKVYELRRAHSRLDKIMHRSAVYMVWALLRIVALHAPRQVTPLYRRLMELARVLHGTQIKDRWETRKQTLHELQNLHAEVVCLKSLERGVEIPENPCRKGAEIGMKSPA